MTGFDAERYLRLLGERAMVEAELAEAERQVSALDHAAAALVVGGVIDLQRAAEISADYTLAKQLVRRPDLAERLARFRPRLPPDPPDLTPRRVFMPDVRLRLAVGELSVGSVTLSPGRTAIEGALVTAAGWALPHGPGTSLTIRAAGQSATTRFSGDLHGDTIAGVWECETSVPDGTDWLDVNGCRLEFGAARPAPSFTVQAFSAEDRLERFLWLLVTGWDRQFGESAAEAAVAALAAAGLLADDALGQAPLGWSRTHRYGTSRADPHRFTGPLSSFDVPAPDPGEGPAAVITRAPPGVSPRATIGIGAVSPRFDGVMVAIDSLTLDGSGLSAEVEVSGVSLHRGLAGGQLDLTPMSWWIADDRANRSLGSLDGASSSDLQTRAKLSFGDLQGEPSWLTIAVATPGATAGIAIALEWR
jgi:hypothetical protein